ncbi:hypothetical protein F4808DRAFT_355162 [Astrocystis sublimbata]|nr:hypothetical protein F4808DRAFT_355079 [Astrocystis sublimbata]KAI0193911.1 hypothetical protein F4808DRAFT_355162 [Astrocystis sublimbata]
MITTLLLTCRWRTHRIILTAAAAARVSINQSTMARGHQTPFFCLYFLPTAVQASERRCHLSGSPSALVEPDSRFTRSRCSYTRANRGLPFSRSIDHTPRYGENLSQYGANVGRQQPANVTWQMAGIIPSLSAMKRSAQMALLTIKMRCLRMPCGEIEGHDNS